MTNGLPPTPPPTSATEIQDEAREQAEASASADVPTLEPAVPINSLPTPTIYQVVVPDLVSLAEQGDFERLGRRAEEVDLNPDDDGHPSRLLLTTVLVLSYLILNDLPPARFALMRLPDNLNTTPLAQALFHLFASTWEREHAKVYMRAEGLLQLVSHADPPDMPVASAIDGMIATFVASFRRRTFDLLEKAYTSLTLVSAQTYLGLATDELLAAAEQRHWSYDATSHVLNPKQSVVAPALLQANVAASSLDTFHRVADRVAKLEL